MTLPNTLAYYDTSTITAVESFIVQASAVTSVKNERFYRDSFVNYTKKVL
jgi:hypothetical protein